MEPNTIANNHLKPPTSFFKWCESHFPIYHLKDKEEIMISSSSKDKYRRKVEYTVRKNTNFSRFDESRLFVIYLATSKRIEVQSWAYYYELKRDLTEDITFRLCNIELFTDDNCYRAGYFGNGNYTDRLVPWSFQTGPYTTASYYPQDYNQVFSKSELRHFDINPFVANSYYYQNLTRLYKYRLGLEYIYKLGGQALFNDIASGRADMRVATKRFIRANRNLIKINIGWDGIVAAHKIRSFGIEPNLNALPYLSHNASLIDDHLELGNFRKVQNYLVKQQCSLQYYDDYLSFLEHLGITPNTDELRFPKDLKLAHDERLAAINLIKEEQEHKARKELEKKARIVTEQLHELEMEIGQYKVVAPRSLEDIVNEGTNLNHCVGMPTYLKKHSAGESVVLFLRKKGLEHESFHTFSFNMRNQITQVQGANNKQTTLRGEIEKLLKEQWLPKAISFIEDVNEV